MAICRPGGYEKTKPIKLVLSIVEWSQYTALFELVLDRVNLWKSNSRFLAVMSAEKRPAPTTLEVRPFQKVINYPASFSAGFTALNFYLLDISLHSSHRTTGRSGRAAAASLVAARLRAGNRTRFLEAALLSTARLRAFRCAWRLGTACCFSLHSRHRSGTRATSCFCRVGRFAVGVTAKKYCPS